jgi:hypothetical protein
MRQSYCRGLTEVCILALKLFPGSSRQRRSSVQSRNWKCSLNFCPSFQIASKRLRWWHQSLQHQGVHYCKSLSPWFCTNFHQDFEHSGSTTGHVGKSESAADARNSVRIEPKQKIQRLNSHYSSVLSFSINFFIIDFSRKTFKIVIVSILNCIPLSKII